ncbi:Gfo/Idh/MocA family oxidoreductase [soil metagenome]
MEKIKVGIIGYGWAATAHIEAINAGGLAEVAAVSSSRPLDAAGLSSKHGGTIKTYREFADLLADPGIGAVSITSYPWQHREHAVAAARAGKHIILEKPLALSLDDAMAIEAAVKESGVTFCLCFEARFSSQFTVTKKVIEQGLLGDVHYGEIDYYHGIGPWYGQFRWNVKRDGGGSSLLSAGCHALDALLFCMGNDVVEVTSLSTRSQGPAFAPYEYDTTSVTLLKFRSGMLGKCTSSIDCLQPYYFHTHLIGSEGSLLDDKLHSDKLALDKGRWSALSMKLMDSGDVSDHPYQSEFDAFFQAIREGKPMPLAGLDESLRTHEVIFAADHSAAAGGKPVNLEEFRAR